MSYSMRRCLHGNAPKEKAHSASYGHYLYLKSSVKYISTFSYCNTWALLISSALVQTDSPLRFLTQVLSDFTHPHRTTAQALAHHTLLSSYRGSRQHRDLLAAAQDPPFTDTACQHPKHHNPFGFLFCSKVIS